MGMDLPAYIKQQGIESSAVLFGVSRHTVSSWMYRARRPKPAKAIEIEALTRGAVTLREIFDRRAA